MPDRTYKLIELVGVSEESTEHAIRNAIARASETLKGLDWFEVVETRGTIQNGAVAQFQVKLKVGFRIMSPDELRAVAREFARKLNKARGPVRILIPTNGWSSVDAPGNPTHDPAEDQAFVETLRPLLAPGVELIEIEANMEDPPFARAVVGAALEFLQPIAGRLERNS